MLSDNQNADFFGMDLFCLWRKVEKCEINKEYCR